MLDYDTWQKVKAECENDAQVSFQRMSAEAQKAMQGAHAAGAKIAAVALGGALVTHPDPAWHPGRIYCILPSSWPGPAKPEPKPEYEDKNVFLVGAACRFTLPSEAGMQWVITLAPSMGGFVGYVYETDGREWCIPTLLVDKQDDGTYRLRVPKAVRFLKGATV